MQVSMHDEAKSRSRSRGVILALALAGTIAVAVSLCFFTVVTGEHAIVTQFGQPVRVVRSPGLELKYPYQRVTKFDSRLFVHTAPPSEFLTLEKTSVIASTAILWRIADPIKYLQTVFDRVGAESRLSDIVFAELGAAVGGTSLASFVSTALDTYRANEILAAVTEKCRNIATRDYGIEVVDVKLQRLDFPERNRPSVFARMKSERVRISMRYRSEGEEESAKIRAEAEQEKTLILSRAFKVAQQHRGEGEAEAARIYAKYLSEGPEFYDFVRTIEALRKLLDDETTVVLPSDSALFGLLHDSDHYSGESNDAEIKVTRDSHDKIEGGGVQ